MARESNERRYHSERIADLLVDGRRFFVLLIAAVTLALSLFVPGLTIDPSLRKLVPPTAEEYLRYERFLEEFGSDELILVVISDKRGDGIRQFVKKLKSVTSKLEKADNIPAVVSVTNLRVFVKRRGMLGSAPVVTDRGDESAPVFDADIPKTRKAFPLLDVLLSRDLRNAGLIVTIPHKHIVDTPYIRAVVETITSAVKSEFGADASFRITGMPVITYGIHRHTRKVVLFFMTSAMIIGLLITFYIFKGIRPGLILCVVCTVSGVWVAGLMSLLGLTLNPIDGLAYGLVVILNLSGTVHVVTHFYNFIRSTADPAEAARKTVGLVGRPLLMCALTTGIGFAGLMTAGSPVVRQIGAIMAMGPLVSFALVIVLTPAFLIIMKPVGTKALARMSDDYVSSAFRRLRVFVFSHQRFCLAAGIVITLIMGAGTFKVKPDLHLFHLLKDSTREMRDLKYVEEHLAPVQTIELVIEAEKGAFKSPEIWQRVDSMERRLRQVPGVEGVNSLLSLLKHLRELTAAPGQSGDALFTKPGVLAELLMITSFSPVGKRVIARSLDRGYGKLRVSVPIRTFGPVAVQDVIADVRSTAESQMKGAAKTTLTGGLEVYATYASGLVRSQVVALVLTLSVITLLMIVQFRSITLGLISLIPNLVPLAVVFGTMGWFGIPLNVGTMIVATVSIGLSVDDTIHYMTQLDRDLRDTKQPPDVEVSLSRAYQITARALISTSAVLFFAFMSLLYAPFQPIALFGLLAAIAMLTALLADLAFMPSVILLITPIRHLLAR